MKNKLLFILTIIFTSCKGQSVLQNIQGNYYKSGKDYKYSLSLNKDSSFVLTQKYFEVISTCKGKWQQLSKDTILLKCLAEDLSAQLNSGYMAERERKVVVLKQNKLKLDKMILKRLKE